MVRDTSRVVIIAPPIVFPSLLTKVQFVMNPILSTERLTAPPFSPRFPKTPS